MGRKSAGGVRLQQVGGNKNNTAAPLAMPDTSWLDEIRLPMPPDRTYQIPWPLQLRVQQPKDIDKSDYFCLYPTYLDASKTLKQGRRVAGGVFPSPSILDVSQALQKLQLPHVIQPYKGYSRDPSVWTNPGRVLVLKKSKSNDTTTLKQQKLQLLRHLVELIPTLPERQARLQREQLEQEQLEQAAEQYRREQAAKSTTTMASSSSAATKRSVNNKKNKIRK
jgi:signal recognition particle subunit SEC65